MTSKLTVSVFVLAGLALTMAACGKTKPPRQVEVADALSDKGADMSSGEDGSGNLKPVIGAKEGVEKMHDKCCGQCKAAMAKDRSGGAPATIPCTDFTAELDPFCLEHFRGKKTMAAECK